MKFGIQPDESETDLKRVITFTVIGINKAESDASMNAFTTKSKVKVFEGIQKNGEVMKFKVYLDKSTVIYLESAGIQIIVHRVNKPTGKTRINGLSVNIHPSSRSFANGLKIHTVVVGTDQKNLRENIRAAERKILAHMRRYHIPAARMCITEDTMCIIKYTDDKTALADLDYFSGDASELSGEEEGDFGV